jgi:hypothetical protein
MDVIRMSLLRDEWKALERPKSWEFAGDAQPAGR